jgi:hypothetical protein
MVSSSMKNLCGKTLVNLDKKAYILPARIRNHAHMNARARTEKYVLAYTGILTSINVRM